MASAPNATQPASPYKGGWEGQDWAHVQREFRLDQPEREPEEVLLARYDSAGYEGSAEIIYRRGGDYLYVSGSHCSCHGLEGQWEPEAYTLETLVAALERGDGGSYDFGGEDGQAMLPMLRRRLTRSRARQRARERLAA